MRSRFVFLLLAFVSCGGEGLDPDRTEVATVTVDPPEITVAIGATANVSATPRDGSGAPLVGRRVFWSSEAPSVATVSETGVVTGLAAGATRLAATVEGKSAFVNVTVTPVSVASVRVTPSERSLQVGEQVQLAAQPLDAAGEALAGRPVVWASTNTAVATVSEAGLVTAVGAGSTTVTATSEGRVGNAAILVSVTPVASIEIGPGTNTIAVGQSAQLSATTKDASGAVLPGRLVQWISSDEAVATVSSTGLVTGVTPGSVEITATSEGQSAKATVAVQPQPVSTVTVSPATPSLVVGGTQQLSAQTRDANGALLNGRAVAWSTSNAAVATVSGAGLVTAVATGQATITATSEGKTATATVTVSQAPVATLTVTPPSLSLVVGTTGTLAASARDAGGNVLSGRAVSWSTGAPSVATVSAAGVVTAVGPGTAVIVASSEGVTTNVQVQVTSVPAAQVTIAPTDVVLPAGESASLTAQVRDPAGNVLPNRTITWSSSDDQIAVVSSTGRVTALRAGTAVVTAASEGVSASVNVVVTLAPVAEVRVAPPTASVVAGSTVAIQASAWDRFGNQLPGRPFTFTSSASNIATVAADGVVTGESPGTARITVTSEGRSAFVDVTVTPAPVATVSVSPSTHSLFVTRTVTLTATARDARGRVLTGRPVAWSSSNTLVATVNAQGVVTARLPGQATITATIEGKTGESRITVTLAPVATVAVALNAPQIVQGQTTQGTATLRDADNNLLTGRNVTWQSSNPSVATVNGSGLVTAVGAGNASITATSEGKSGSAPITVLPIPVASVSVTPGTPSVAAFATVQLAATPRDVNGNALTGRQVSWSTSNAAVATVNGSGVVTGVSVGTATITATSEGKSGTATVTVTPPPVAAVTVALNAGSLSVGQTTQATATTRDAGGGVLTGRTVTWSSSNTSIATVNASGLVTAVSSGTAAITATSEGKSGSANVSVSLAPIATVEVSLASPSIVVGSTTQATALPKDGNGNALPGRTTIWSSSNTSIATVNASGLVTAVAEGTASITATVEGVAGSATVTVARVPVDRIDVAVADPSLDVGETTQATATVRDASGKPINDRAVTWTTSAASVATVNAQGLVTAVGPGSASITATTGSKSGSATVNVEPAPVATVAVTLNAASIDVGQTTQASAVARDSRGTVLTGRPVTWSSSNEGVATVSTQGVVTGVAAGSATITANIEGRTGSAGVTITRAPVATVAVALNASTITQGQTTQATATLRDAAGNVVTGRTVTWESSNTGVATVSGSGLVTGVAPGSAQITARSEGQSGSASLTVSVVPVASVTVAPPSATIQILRTVQLTATVADASGNVLTGRDVTWSSDNPLVAAVSSTGLVRGILPGTTTVRASAGGQAGSAAITVTLPPPAAVATVSVSPSTATAEVGETEQFEAITRDETGELVTGRAVTWASSNTAVATVGGSGLATAVGAGETTITATSEGRSGTATLTVTAPPPPPPEPVVTVDVLPAAATVEIGDTEQLAATPRAGNGTPLTDRAVAWSTSNAGVATVSTTGLVTAVAQGSATITATSEGKTGTSTITVPAPEPPPPAPVVTVDVAPTSATVDIGQTRQLTATPRDAGGNALDRPVAWSSSNAGVATVDGAGLVTAVTAGTATITATSEGKSGTSTITVPEPPPPAAPRAEIVSFAANNQTIALGGSVDITIVGRNTGTAPANTGGYLSLAIRELTDAADVDLVQVVAPGSGTVRLGAGTLIRNAEGQQFASSYLLTELLHARWAPDESQTFTIRFTPDAPGTYVVEGKLTLQIAGFEVSASPQSGPLDQQGFNVQQLTITVQEPAEPNVVVTVAPAEAELSPGETFALNATVRNRGGQLVPGAVVDWSSEDERIARVTQWGVVTGVNLGSTTILAKSRGAVGRATARVVPGPSGVMRLFLTPRPAAQGGPRVSLSESSDPAPAAGAPAGQAGVPEANTPGDDERPA